jgi:hypothetical protein
MVYVVVGVSIDVTVYILDVGGTSSVHEGRAIESKGAILLWDHV